MLLFYSTLVQWSEEFIFNKIPGIIASTVFSLLYVKSDYSCFLEAE